MKIVSRLLREDEGQDLIEYALFMACLSVVFIGFVIGARTGLIDAAAAAGARLVHRR